MRWWALFGTAATLILSLCLLIEYYALLDRCSDRGLRSLHHPKTLLDARVDEAMRREAQRRAASRSSATTGSRPSRGSRGSTSTTPSPSTASRCR